MITVYGRRNSMNVQKVMWTLGELGLEYHRLDVAGSFGFPPEYQGLNPNGVVPTIQDGELTLWESNACVRYLARTYGQGSLWPSDPIALAHGDQWMDWASSTMNPAFFGIFMNLIRLPAERANMQQVAASVDRCETLVQHLDRHLADQPFMAGDSLTIGDISLGCVFYRYFNMKIERPEVPNLSAWYERLCERQAYRKHVMIPFGSNAEEWLAEEKKSAGVQ